MIERRDITRNSTSCRHSYNNFFLLPLLQIKSASPYFPLDILVNYCYYKSIIEWEKCVYLKACRMKCPIPMGIGSKNI